MTAFPALLKVRVSWARASPPGAAALCTGPTHAGTSHGAGKALPWNARARYVFLNSKIWSGLMVRSLLHLSEFNFHFPGRCEAVNPGHKWDSPWPLAVPLA